MSAARRKAKAEMRRARMAVEVEAEKAKLQAAAETEAERLRRSKAPRDTILGFKGVTGKQQGWIWTLVVLTALSCLAGTLASVATFGGILLLMKLHNMGTLLESEATAGSKASTATELADVTSREGLHQNLVELMHGVVAAGGRAGSAATLEQAAPQVPLPVPGNAPAQAMGRPALQVPSAVVTSGPPPTPNGSGTGRWANRAFWASIAVFVAVLVIPGEDAPSHERTDERRAAHAGFGTPFPAPAGTGKAGPAPTRTEQVPSWTAAKVADVATSEAEELLLTSAEFGVAWPFEAARGTLSCGEEGAAYLTFPKDVDGSVDEVSLNAAAQRNGESSWRSIPDRGADAVNTVLKAGVKAKYHPSVDPDASEADPVKAVGAEFCLGPGAVDPAVELATEPEPGAYTHFVKDPLVLTASKFGSDWPFATEAVVLKCYQHYAVVVRDLYDPRDEPEGAVLRLLTGNDYYGVVPPWATSVVLDKLLRPDLRAAMGEYPSSDEAEGYAKAVADVGQQYCLSS